MAHEYVKENDTFNTSRNGTVPKPTQAEVTAGKVLKADGTWGEGGGGGSSTLAGLTDVDLSNPSDGQILKYDAENDEWVNDNESGGTVTDVNVNGESVVDSNGKAQIVSYKEVTLAEYMALPNTKINDGVMYCIKDIGGANQFPPLIYSDEEREVGVWRDGKPLYQKTFASTSSSRSVEWDISTLNIETVVSQKGSWCRKYNSNNKIYWYSVDFIASADASYRAVTNVSLNDNVLISNIDMPTGNTILYRAVTIQYTKTTDTAGSGTWTTQGGYAHHYSTDEKVIGTWIEGKPLYEKTITFTTSSSATDQQQVLNVLNADKYFVTNAYVISSGSYSTSMQGYKTSVNSDEFCGTVGNISGVGLRLEYRVGSNNYNASGSVTVQYTKTTD